MKDDTAKTKFGSFTIEFRSSEWAKFNNDWVKPSQPMASGTLNSPPKTATGALILSYSAALSLGIVYNLF